MIGKRDFRLLFVFSIAFSLGVLMGPSSAGFHLPAMQLTRALLQPCQAHGSGGACSELWYPAGPETNTELAIIFTDSVAELVNLQSSSPSIDFTDTPLSPSSILPLETSPNFLVTAPISQTGYYEVQFMLANNFWGCQFNFGNAACGTQIRQGIAHMIDKTSFTNNQFSIAGISTPIDNPVPTSSAGGLTTPNPCGYDSSFPETNATTANQCIVGSAGGTSYHLAAATGADGFPWLAAPGSADLNAAAQHFVNAGLATGLNSSTSVLRGVSSAAASNQITFFIRNDDPSRLDLGQSLAAQICYIFTGSYTAPCAYLAVVFGNINQFIGFQTSPTSVHLNWWMYTAAFSEVSFFDDSLYFTYNSRFVSGIPSIQPPCSSQAVPSSNAPNYMYLCSPTYDSLSSEMENAPSLAQAVTFGVQAEAYFGANAFTLPIFERTIQFAYLNNGWIRAINNNDVGLPNYFTWLNVWNPAPPLAGTIRQGFSETTRSVNPYAATTTHDFFIVNNVFDSLYVANPLSPSQIINWMTTSTFQLPNSALTYQAPANTLTTYRFTLRPDAYFQDGRSVTAYDAAFSYLSTVGAGSFIGSQAAVMTGVTVLGPRQFDIGVSSLGPFTLPNLTGIPIVPARYWTNAGSPAWDSAAMTCTSGPGCPISQFVLSGSTVICALSCSPFSANLMTVNPADVAATFDPIANHIFLGSGPWQCGAVTSVGSGTCTSTGAQNPPPGGSYTLTRFGNGLAPASNVSGIYFRSAGNLALWTWAADGMGAGPGFITFAQVAACYGQPVNLSGPCAHWQQGIGNDIGPGGHVVGINQVAIVTRFVNVNWLAPFNWQSNPPTGIAQFAPVLYEGSAILNPCSIDPVNGYDC